MRTMPIQALPPRQYDFEVDRIVAMHGGYGRRGDEAYLVMLDPPIELRQGEEYVIRLGYRQADGTVPAVVIQKREAPRPTSNPEPPADRGFFYGCGY